MTRLSRAIIFSLVLCVAAPFVWYEVYAWQYCWFPPSGPNVELVVSACESPWLQNVSPDGRYLAYWTPVSGDGYQEWLLDTASGKRVQDPGCGGWGEWWLSNTIRLGGHTGSAQYHGAFWICDLHDGTKVSVTWAEDVPGAIEQAPDGIQTYSPEVLHWFQSAKQIYYIASNDWAVALGADFKTHPENTYVLTNASHYPPNSVLKFLEEHQIGYHRISSAYDGMLLVSHNGRFQIPASPSLGFQTSGGQKIGPLFDYIASRWCCGAYG